MNCNGIFQEPIFLVQFYKKQFQAQLYKILFFLKYMTPAKKITWVQY